MMPKLSVKPLFQMVESNDRSPSWSPSTSDRVITLSFGRSIFAMKTNKNELAAIRPMMMATSRNLRQWRRMKLGRAFVVTGQELRLTRIRLQAGKPVHHSEKSPACWCVSITLPASSKTRITALCERLRCFACRLVLRPGRT